MAKIKDGIDIPIIPEDFILSDDTPLDMIELFLRWIDSCIQKGLDPEDTSMAEIYLFDTRDDCA